MQMTPLLLTFLFRCTAAIVTTGGTWTAVHYEAINSQEAADRYGEGGTNRGCTITLEFMPDAENKCAKIGLIQAVLSSTKGGKNYDIILRNQLEDPEKRKIMRPPAIMKAQRSDGRGHIDRNMVRMNPIYGAPDSAEIKNTPRTDGIERGSTHYKLGGKKMNFKWRIFPIGKTTVAAGLLDTPTFGGQIDGDGYAFETGALCIEGSEVGKWYGSVLWGFDFIEGKNVVQEFKKGGQDLPSRQFMGLVQIWNQLKDHTKIPRGKTGFKSLRSGGQFNHGVLLPV